MENSSLCTGSGPDLLDSDFPPYYITLMKLNSLFITLLNTQVLVCLAVKRKLFTGNYWAQVVCLSSSDILSGIGVWIMTTIEYQDVKTNVTLCSMAHLINIIAQIATLLNVFWICVRRFWGMQKLERPDKSRNVLDVFIQMTVVWILSTSFCILPFVIWTKTDCIIQGCSFSALFGSSYYKAVGLLFSGLFLPLILTNFIYLAIMIRLRKLLQRIRPLIEQPSIRTKDNTDNNKVRIAKHASHSTSRVGSGGTQTGVARDSPYLNDIGDHTVSPSSSRTDSRVSERDAINTSNLDTSTVLNLRGTLSDKHNENIQYLSIPGAHRNQHAFTHDVGTVPTDPAISDPLHVHYLNKIQNLVTQRNQQIFSLNSNQPFAQTTMIEVRLRKQRRSMMIIGTILVLLNLFTWPSAIISAMSLSPSLKITYEHKVLLLGIVTMNSLVNPFVYSVRIPEFRKALKELYFDCYHFFVSLCSR